MRTSSAPASSAVRRISEVVTENGEHGASAICTIAPSPRLVITRHHAFAVGEDGVLVLHDAVRRQAAVALRQVHRAARQQHAQAEPLGRRDFDVDGVFEPCRKNIMMIGRRGAAGQHQFRHRQGHAEIERLRRQPRPDRIKRLQPWKQLAVERRRHGARERLIEMMMGVDQAGQHHMFGGVEYFHIRRGGCRSRRHQLDDAAVFADDPALGAVGENGEGIFDPQRWLFLIRHADRVLSANELYAIRKLRITQADPHDGSLAPCRKWAGIAQPSHAAIALIAGHPTLLAW